jgi:hypothetical protein
LFSTLLFLYSQAGFAQDNEAAVPPESESESDTAAETKDTAAGQEVEINEDNYRQFMELRDARQQRNVLPENAFKPKSGSQKLDDLPEASQKHLRNQLREIIVQGDEWQPGDEGDVYPYVPSEAAGTDPSLQKQEAEAWGELVDSYHARESQIHENSAMTQAAQAAGGSPGGGSPNGSESGGDKEGEGETQDGAGGQAGDENSAEQASSADSYSPNASKDPNAKSTSGVSQNAMEFLKGMADRNGEPSGTGTGNSNEDAGQQEQQGQMPAGQGDPTTPGSPSGGSSSNATDTKSTAGTSQSAMDYLNSMANQEGKTGETGTGDSNEGTGQQASQEQMVANPENQNSPAGGNSQKPADTTSTAGSSQNAMEFLNKLAGGEGKTGGTGTGDSNEGTGQQASQEQAAASQGSSPGQDSPTGGEAQDPADTKSTEGATQNALDYLNQGDGQNESETLTDTGASDGGEGQSNGSESGSEGDQELADQQVDDNKQSNETSVSANINFNPSDQDEEVSTQGTSQNALEYLTGDPVEVSPASDNGQEPVESEGTLSIQDLLNAQGVGTAVGTTPSPSSSSDEPVPDKNKDEKDGDG